VVIVHYDSVGPTGQEALNPGADDDATGLSTMLESARVFASGAFTLAKTIRFVLSDYEELGNPTVLEGARKYAAYVQNEATTKGFKIATVLDYEQSGWNCLSNGKCPADAGGTVMHVVDCELTNDSGFAFHEVGTAFIGMSNRICAPLAVSRVCLDDLGVRGSGALSDNYALWEIGVPGVITSEYVPVLNPHFDQNGGDTFDKIDTTYFVKIARMAIAFTAEVAGATLVGGGDAAGGG
jgi:hypothetical protein